MSTQQNPNNQCDKVISDMFSRGVITQEQEELLRTTNQTDPDRSHWFIASLDNFSRGINEPISDENFVRVCLMSVHRFQTQNSLRPNASDNQKISKLFDSFANMGVPENTNDGSGLLLAIRNYLTRTVEEVGLSTVEIIEKELESKGQSWEEFDNQHVYFNARAKAELDYIKNLEQTEGDSILEPITQQINSKRSLTELLGLKV